MPVWDLKEHYEEGQEGLTLPDGAVAVQVNGQDATIARSNWIKIKADSEKLVGFHAFPPDNIQYLAHICGPRCIISQE